MEVRVTTTSSEQAIPPRFRVNWRRFAVYGTLAPVVAFASEFVGFEILVLIAKLLPVDPFGVGTSVDSTTGFEAPVNVLKYAFFRLLLQTFVAVSAILFAWFVLVRPRRERSSPLSICAYGAFGYAGGFVVGSGVGILSAAFSPHLILVPPPLFAFSGLALGLTLAMDSAESHRAWTVLAAQAAGLTVGILTAIAFASDASVGVWGLLRILSSTLLVVLCGVVMFPGSPRPLPSVMGRQASSVSTQNAAAGD